MEIIFHSVNQEKFDGDDGNWPWNWTWRMGWTFTHEVKELGISSGWQLHEKHFGVNKAEWIVWFVSYIEYLVSNSEIGGWKGSWNKVQTFWEKKKAKLFGFYHLFIGELLKAFEQRNDIIFVKIWIILMLNTLRIKGLLIYIQINQALDSKQFSITWE